MAFTSCIPAMSVWMIVRLFSHSLVVESDMVAVAGGQRTILDRQGRNGRSSADEQL